MKLGFIGTGTLSAAVIGGLATTSRPDLQIVVSPRSETVSKQLATKYGQVDRAASNQEVIDRTDVVVIAVRPQDLNEVLSTLEFRHGQTVVSFVAGATNEAVAACVKPASSVIRVTPLPMIEQRKGPILVFPEDPGVITLFKDLGTVIVPRSQDEVIALGYAGGLMATFFAMTNTSIDWLEEHALARTTAKTYLFSMYEALASKGLDTPCRDLDGLPHEFSTPGGINQRCAQHLADIGWFRSFATGLDAMETHLTAVVNRK